MPQIKHSIRLENEIKKHYFERCQRYESIVMQEMLKNCTART